MKLTKLNTVVKNYKGQPVEVAEPTPEKPDNRVELTFGTALLQNIYQTKAQDGKESVRISELCRKLYQSDTIDITAEDFLLLKKAVETNTASYFAAIQGEVYAFLESFDKTEDKA